MFLALISLTCANLVSALHVELNGAREKSWEKLKISQSNEAFSHPADFEHFE